MKIAIRPGHGFTPPAPLCYPKDSGLLSWSRQRPGGYARPAGHWYEDDWTALFCARLVPALQLVGHEVTCQRALPGTDEGDEVITVGPRDLPQLPATAPTWTGPRWQLCAAVESVLRGTTDPAETWGWSFDPQASCAREFRGPRQDLYLSIHVNWYTDPRLHGCGAFHYPGSRGGEAAARSLLDGIKRSCAAAGGDLAAWAGEDESAVHPWGSPEHRALLAAGERWGRYTSKLWELRATRAPAALLELGFASHRPASGPSDLDRLTSEAGQDALVNGIVAALPV